MMTVVRIEPHPQFLIVTLQSDAPEDLKQARLKKAARTAGTPHGCDGRVEQRTNPYFVDAAGRIKKDVSPFRPGDGDWIRVEYRVYPPAGKCPDYGGGPLPSPW